MLTPEQSRAARGLLRLRPEDLSERTGISTPTIRAFEAGSRATMPANLRVIRLTLEAEGVVFLAADEQAGPGVRLRKPAGEGGAA